MGKAQAVNFRERHDHEYCFRSVLVRESRIKMVFDHTVPRGVGADFYLWVAPLLVGMALFSQLSPSAVTVTAVGQAPPGDGPSADVQ